MRKIENSVFFKPRTDKKMTTLQFTLPSITGRRRLPESRSILRPIRCAADRQALFNRIAPVYDNLNDLLSLGAHRIWKRMAVSWSGAKEGDTVLDVCCGSGDLAFLMSEKSWNQWQGAITYRRISPNQAIEGLLQEYRVVGDAVDLPFSGLSFDAATIGYGLRNVLDRKKAIDEMCRVLKPGSKLSVIDFNKSTNPLPSSIQDLMIDYVVVPVANGYGVGTDYQYLKNSIKEYLTGNELEKLALEAGFSRAKHYEIGGGLMGNLVATL